MNYRELSKDGRFITRPGKHLVSFKLINFNENKVPEIYILPRNKTKYYLFKAKILYKDKWIIGDIGLPKIAISSFFNCWDLNENPNCNMSMQYIDGAYIFNLEEEINVFV